MWDEAEYTENLLGERRRCAWVMRRYGTLGPDEARAAAQERYPYEPEDAPFRGLIFHDEARHWAMLALRGEHYWREHPELLRPPAEYETIE